MALAVGLAALLTTPAAACAEMETVKVAAQVDRSSGRLVLEWRQPVDYTVQHSPPYLSFHFSRPFTGELETAQRALSRYLGELRLAGGGRVLVLRVVGQPRFEHFQHGNTVVLAWAGADLMTGAEMPAETGAGPRRTPPEAVNATTAPPRPASPPEPRTETPPLPRAGPPQSSPVAPRAEAARPPRPAAPPEPPAETRPLPHPGLPEAAPVTPRAEDAKPPPIATAPEADPAKPEIRPPPEARPMPEGELRLEAPASSPTLTVSSNGAETRVVMAWPQPVGAAVFRYGDNIWMVFAHREAFDLEPFQRLLGPGVERLVRIEHAQATVLAARARADVRARLVHGRNVWTVVLEREPGAASALDAKIAIARGSDEQVSIPLPGAEAPIRVIDPEIGSTLHVVPSRAVAGLGAERGFVTFRLVPALQGGVVEALADGLVVGAENASIIIRRDGGLLLSNGGPKGPARHGQ